MTTECTLPGCGETRPHYHRGDDEMVMTPPAVDTGIVAFIEAQLKRREETAQKVLDVFGSFAARTMAEWVIAEVAKDRAILALHQLGTDLADYALGWQVCRHCGHAYPCQTVRLLAAIDADHPAFRPEWKPVAT